MLDAVVVTHDLRAQALRCLRALASSTCPPSRTIVVDNGTDGTAADIAQSDGLRAETIERPDNPGFGGAANAGAAVSTAPLLLVCNADVYPAHDALQRLVEHMQAEPDVACAGPALLNLDGSRQEAAFRFPGLAQAIIDIWPAPGWLRRSRLNGRIRADGAPVEIDHPLGAFMLLRRLAFDMVGGFATEFWMYSEETDLCRRLKSAGWRVTHVPAARVWHAGGASTRRHDSEMLAALYDSRFRWFERHASPPVAVLARAAMRAGLFARAHWPGPRQHAYARAFEASRRV